MRALIRFLTSWRGALLSAAALLIVLLKAADWTAELLWMSALDHPEVFWTIRETKVLLFFAAAIPVFIFVFVNLHVLQARTDIFRVLLGPRAVTHDAAVRAFPVVASTIVALVVGFSFYSSWDMALRFVFGPEIGDVDPVYGRDLGFHLFNVPFFWLIRGWLLLIVFAVGVGVAGGYLYTRAVHPDKAEPAFVRAALTHTAVNVALFLAALAWSLWLDRFALLTDSSGAVFGAGYTDVNVTRRALWVGMALCLLAIAASLVLARRGSERGMIATLAGFGIALFVITQIVPGVVQAFVVEPNELELETPYLERNIAATRRAFKLDQITSQSYAPKAKLTRDDLNENEDTIDNIRLWDWRPLSRTFRQLQQIRAYYEFNDVDVDRYLFDGDYRQVLLSARELSADLPGRGQNWVNRHLQYTHGIGLAMAYASRKGPEGVPVLIVKDLPPVADVDLPIERPELYYGEGMAGYRVVSTDVQEFDYPQGDENVYTSYQGTGGVLLDAAWKVGLFALHQGSTSLLLTDYLTERSRIQFWRALQQRIHRLAPFLKLDRDPYLAVADGRLYWIQDAYTTSDNYPYSEIYLNDLNYIRNSVKIVVDAYNGDIGLYVFAPDDPVLQAYRAAFPKLFKPMQEMPQSLRRHIRYPQDLFEAQVNVYSTYHMTIPQVFYNREDVWQVPREKYGGEAIEMKPYYILMRLPNEERLQFLLMQPLTPSKRDNMIAWVAARSDLPDYGELLVYKLPKERLILGPIQIEAKIDQDTEISRQLSLWDQRGSRVTRGNLLVIPIENAFLYVEPVYLLAEGTDLPQLKRIIVSDGEKLAMEPTLAEALNVVFGGARQRPPDAGAQAGAPAPQRPLPELSEARDALDRAQQALEDGDWAAFGQAMQELKSTLDEAAGRQDAERE